MPRSSGTSPEQRAQLLRELSQDLNRTRNSSASARLSQATASPNTTTSDFDPDNEALVSTRQFETVAPEHMFTQLRASAEKYNRFRRGPPSERPSELDYAIDTSAIGRAFPDFTQGGSSSDDGSMSIELGRGLKKGSSNTIGKLGKSSRSQTSAMSNRDDSFDFSAPMVGNHYVAATPPLVNPKTRSHNGSLQNKQADSTQARQSSGLRNEVRNTSSPTIKTKDYVSGSSRQGSENRQTLAAIHARVRDENDASHISEDRPPTIDVAAKSSRFSSARHQSRDHGKGLPARFSSKQEFTQPAPSNDADATAMQRPLPGGVPTSDLTTQSIKVPQMPNVSELLSGVFDDGTPVFSAKSKPRSSRFASGARAQRRQISGVDDIDVPQEEQDIYVSLQIAEDKVAELEQVRGEAEYTIGELQERVRTLEVQKADQRRRQRSDSAIGSTDGGSDAGDEMSGGHRKLLIEKNRLDSSVRAFSDQVKTLERKAAVSEKVLRNVTKGRDSALAQLGVAYVTIEQLKSENAQLVDENQELRDKLALNTLNRKEEPQTNTRTERNSISDHRRGVSTVGDRERAHSQAGPPIKGPKRQNKQTTNDKSSKLRFDEQLAAHASTNAHSRKKTNENSKLSTKKDNRLSHREEDHPTDIFPTTEETQRSVVFPESEGTEQSETENVEQRNYFSHVQQSLPERGDQFQNTTRDLTYLSFMDNDDVAELRRRLEYERFERKQKQQRNQTGFESRSRDHTMQTDAVEQPKQEALPRKSSLKTTTRRFADSVDTTERSSAGSDADISHKLPTEHTRRHSESSLHAKRQQWRQQEVENMTSAFILPDITIREPAPELSAAGEKILDDLKNHDRQNCTVCHQTTELGSSDDRTGATKETITVPKPVPVSNRMPEPDEYNEDPTIRPSQPPALALATVLKGMEDELAHQKIQLAKYQKLYSGHDPALSKRQRKSVYARIGQLLQAIDVKADQIYSLYDVLEGQKQDGHEITEKEVEVTLQSIGVDVADLGLRGGGMDGQMEDNPIERHPWDLESNASEDELPWEGIDSTTDTTKSGRGLNSRHRSSAT